MSKKFQEYTAPEIVSNSNRLGRVFTPNTIEFRNFNTRTNTLFLKVGKYTVQIALPDLKIFSKDQGTPEAKIELAVTGDVKVFCSCLTGDTLIKLLDGRNVPIKDIPTDKVTWVYASDDQGDFVPARAISWGVTKKVKTIYRIWLDNGDYIDCTDNHKFRLRNLEYKEAKDLSIGESLLPLYTRINHKGYEHFQYNSTQSWQPTHTKVNRSINSVLFECKLAWRNRVKEKFLVTHHIDSDKRNNSPENLQWMGVREHWQYHAELGTERLSVTWDRWNDPEFREKESKRLSIIGKIPSEKREQSKKDRQEKWRAWVDSGEGRAFYSDHFKKCAQNRDKKVLSELRISENRRLWQDQSFRDKMKLVQTENGRKLMNAPEYQKNAVKGRVFRIYAKIIAAGYPLETITSDLYKQYKSQTSPWPLKIFSSYEESFELYKTWNHKVSKIEILTYEEEIPVYDLFVEKHHNFALASGIFVHNCKDYQYRFAYVDTQLAFGIYKETRPANITNPDGKGTCCKHLVAALTNLGTFVPDMTKVLNTNRTESLIQGIINGESVDSLLESVLQDNPYGSAYLEYIRDISKFGQVVAAKLIDPLHLTILLREVENIPGLEKFIHNYDKKKLNLNYVKMEIKEKTSQFLQMTLVFLSPVNLDI